MWFLFILSSYFNINYVTPKARRGVLHFYKVQAVLRKPSIVHLYPTCHQKVEHPSQRSPAIGFSKLIIRNSYSKNLPKEKESVRIIVY